MTSEAADSIWTKLRDCADGEGTLDADDASEILLLLSSLIHADVNKSYEEVAESIYQSIGEEDLHSLDEEFLRYLTSHYAKVTHENSCVDLRLLLDSTNSQVCDRLYSLFLFVFGESGDPALLVSLAV